MDKKHRVSRWNFHPILPRAPGQHPKLYSHQSNFVDLKFLLTQKSVISIILSISLNFLQLERESRYVTNWFSRWRTRDAALNLCAVQMLIRSSKWSITCGNFKTTIGRSWEALIKSLWVEPRGLERQQDWLLLIFFDSKILHKKRIFRFKNDLYKIHTKRDIDFGYRCFSSIWLRKKSCMWCG